MIYQFKNYFYKIYLKKRYSVKFAKKVKLNKDVFFEGQNFIGNNTEFTNSTIGLGSYIANNSVIRMTKIGRFCAIGDNVRTCLGLHPSKIFVSLHPAFFSLKKQAGFTFVEKQLFEEHIYVENTKYVVDIGNDVWIGNNVTIMDGISIGDGSILATGSVVTKNVEPYSIVGGIPAKIIKFRFNEDTIKKLIKIKWWNKEFFELKEKNEIFSDIDIFLKNYINE